MNENFNLETKEIKELFASGMNVGKDIIGTMANTLILGFDGIWLKRKALMAFLLVIIRAS